METNKRKALGKGLEQLFSNESLYSNPLETLDEMSHNASNEDVIEVRLDELRPNPYQPRRTFDNEKLQELANSIREFGVLEPSASETNETEQNGMGDGGGTSFLPTTLEYSHHTPAETGAERTGAEERDCPPRRPAHCAWRSCVMVWPL